MERKYLYDISRPADPVRLFPFDRSIPRTPAAEEGPKALAEDAQDVESLKASAWAEGFEAGKQAGFQAGLVEGRDTLERLSSLLEALERERAEWIRRWQEEMVQLCLAVAQRIVLREISLDPLARLKVVEAGLGKLKESQRVDVRVASSEFGALREALPGLCERLGAQGRVRVLEDAGLQPGDVVFETDTCEVDGRIRTALEAIEEALRAP